MKKYGFKGGLTVNGSDVERILKIDPIGKEFYNFSINGYSVLIPYTVALDVAKWIREDVEYRNA